MDARLAASLVGALLLTCTSVQAQQAPASAEDTDPASLGWMEGSPPPDDKVVRHGDASYYTFPRSRWAFSNMRALFPTASLWRGERPAIAITG